MFMYMFVVLYPCIGFGLFVPIVIWNVPTIFMLSVFVFTYLCVGLGMYKVWEVMHICYFPFLMYCGSLIIRMSILDTMTKKTPMKKTPTHEHKTTPTKESKKNTKKRFIRWCCQRGSKRDGERSSIMKSSHVEIDDKLCALKTLHLSLQN